MKGLPLTYSKDMQDDKAPTFAATDTILLSLAAMTGMIADLEANTERMAAAAGQVRSHIGRTGPMSALGEIFDELEAGAYVGRAVLTDMGS